MILSHQRMKDQELGKLNLIEADKDGCYIFLDTAAAPSLGKLYLERHPLSQGYLVGNGATCYRERSPDSSHWDYVLKFKWRWARKRPEDELLKLGKEKCVSGAASLHYYKEFESTTNLRGCLR